MYKNVLIMPNMSNNAVTAVKRRIISNNEFDFITGLSFVAT
jgi:hypothetical protein